MSGCSTVLNVARIASRRALRAGWIGLVAVIATALPAVAAGNFDFLAAPDIHLNRIYRLDRTTGEVAACQFALKEGSPVGVTVCYQPGQGAGAQGSSDYALVSSRHEEEGGVARVDLRTGSMSICFVLSEHVVCTPPSK